MAPIEQPPGILKKRKKQKHLATKLGYSKVSTEKLDVAIKIRNYVIGGGFMFAMCSATDSFDIALSAEGVDICEPMFDGDGSDSGYQNKIDYNRTFAFTNFILERSPIVYEFSSIDMTQKRAIPKNGRLFFINGFFSKMGSNSHYVMPKSYSFGKRVYGTNYGFYKR